MNKKNFSLIDNKNNNGERNEIIVYQPEGGEFHIEVRVENETVWLTQAQMAELFDVHRQAITKHVKNIYESHELDEMSTSSILELVQKEGNDTSLSLVAKRAVGVNAIIYSARITRAMKDEVDRINRQFPTVVLRTMRDVHDRFIIVDETVYHVGASIMDLGCKMTAFSVLNLVTKEQLLALVK